VSFPEVSLLIYCFYFKVLVIHFVAQADIAESHKIRTHATMQRFHRLPTVPVSSLSSSGLAEHTNGGPNMSAKDPKITVCWQVCLICHKSSVTVFQLFSIF